MGSEKNKIIAKF